MKTKIAASIVVIAGLSLTGCGFVNTDSSENTETTMEETVVETSEEVDNGAVSEEQGSTEDIDLSETLQDEGRIIFAPTFSKTETGGVETVLLDETATDEQIEILRNRLMGNATMQENGLAQDPAQIYGADIPGIDYLSENRDKYETIYTEVPRGGSVEYKSNDPKIIEAIHEWIDYSLRTYRITDSEETVDNPSQEPNSQNSTESANDSLVNTETGENTSIESNPAPNTSPNSGVN